MTGAEILLDRFDALVDTPEAVEKLRRFVLDLAVRGKLVAQDLADESAETLLQRIAEEKRQRYEDGEIRKPKKLKPVAETELPFEIPQGWAWTRLGLIGEVVGGGTPKSKEPNYWSDNGVPWLTPADLNGHEGKRIARGRRDISRTGLNNSSAQLLPSESVLFSSRAPIGYVAIAASPLATNQGFKSIVPYIEGLTEYLYYFLLQAGPGIDAAASGTTFKEVSGKSVSLVPIPVPPVDEQRRIVARVDDLMALCDRLADGLARSRAAAERLLGTALYDASRARD